eukprot:775173-Pelagomonas_calceolata.AAC.4
MIQPSDDFPFSAGNSVFGSRHSILYLIDFSLRPASGSSFCSSFEPFHQRPAPVLSPSIRGLPSAPCISRPKSQPRMQSKVTDVRAEATRIGTLPHSNPKEGGVHSNSRKGGQK